MTGINFWIERRLRDAGRADAGAAYELGIAYSSGTEGVEVSMVEAHKWFNLAAVWGDARAQSARAEIAEEMTAREIADAQREARGWLGGTVRRAA